MFERHAHRYDGKEYDFRDDDQSAYQGRHQVAALLGLSKLPQATGLRFDLSFYSGGIGVLDRHAITMDADRDLWSTTSSFLNARTPTESATDKEWGDDFKWLVTRDEPFPTIDDATIAFINSERESFQAECLSGMHVLFSATSDVNDWSVLWGTDFRLNFLAYSQG